MSADHSQVVELPWTLTEREQEQFAAYAAQHGLAALLDHLGLDGLANDVVAGARQLEQVEAERDRYKRLADSSFAKAEQYLQLARLEQRENEDLRRTLSKGGTANKELRGSRSPRDGVGAPPPFESESNMARFCLRYLAVETMESGMEIGELIEGIRAELAGVALHPKERDND